MHLGVSAMDESWGLRLTGANDGARDLVLDGRYAT
jgi:hypothetical protein